MPRECFPRALKYRLGSDGALSHDRTEPIAADARPEGDGKENTKLKLIAGLLGIGYDSLKQRELEAHRARFRRLAAIAGAVIFALSSLLALSLIFLLTSEKTRNDALMAQSRFLARDARAATSSGNAELGMLLSIAALPHNMSDPDRPITLEAVGALNQAEIDFRDKFVLRGHTSTVGSAAFSPDGRRIVTASWDDTIRIWDAVTGQQLLQLGAGGVEAASACFSPDGKRIVAALWDSTAHAWDATTGQQLMQFDGHTEGLNDIAFSSDGTRVVTSASDNTARIWNAATGQELMQLSGHTDNVRTAAFSPDGARIVTASNDKTARIWGAGTGRQLVLLSGHTDQVNSAAFSPDGQHVLTTSDDGTARIWDAATGRQLMTLNAHTKQVTSAAFSPDGLRIATASWDKFIRIWDSSTGQLLNVLGGHTGPVKSVAFSPDGKQIVTGSDDGTARIWDLAPSTASFVPFIGHTRFHRVRRFLCLRPAHRHGVN